MTRRKLQKVLIANRGEIALRVIRACSESGLESVALFSEADRTSLHVRAASEAYLLGPSPATESYLNQDRVIAIARLSGADAVHPGYGFLAENADFAAKVVAEGFTWIGPPPDAMRRLGDKLEARKVAKDAGVPVVPGTDVAVDDFQQALAAAESLTYPLLIKASAGGGGKGMRIVRSESELESALRSARSEATSSFGSGKVYLEKYLESVRHVEIQLLGDQYGHVVHLGERECSIQRRYQKLIEEAPSVVVDDELRRRMGSVAVEAAKAVGYYSTGTVEFLVDNSGNFYFLEVNTRLQVEHPVTELVCGVDLVLEQLRIASGEPLAFTQEDISFRGHAIECRIAAEDPYENFVPSLGEITYLREPSGPGVRVDSGIYRGCTVSVFYDPMLAKLIVWAPTRSLAIRRMERALQEYRILGVQTNLPFHLSVARSSAFKEGQFDTNFAANHLGSTGSLTRETDQSLQRVAAIGASLVAARRLNERSDAAAVPPVDAIQGPSRWRLAGIRDGLL